MQPLRAFLIDDEPLAVRRLQRMLEETGRVLIAGSSSDPRQALEALRANGVDVVFLDIEMPEMNGFELISQLEPQPLVVFTTAYNQYALQAFEVNSVDYLLKPVEPRHLDRALNKLERIRGGAEPRPNVQALIAELSRALERKPEYPERIASKLGERVLFIDLSQVTHFFAKDKLTFASAAGKAHVVDQTITELEERLDPRRFVRIHRAVIANLSHVHELHNWFGGRQMLRLKDGTELTVARERVAGLRERLGL